MYKAFRGKGYDYLILLIVVVYRTMENKNRLNRFWTQKSMNKWTRAKTLKLAKTELWFFALHFLFNEIYLPIKFCIDISYSFRVMSLVKFKV
jgi:hypothetical protein